MIKSTVYDCTIRELTAQNHGEVNLQVIENSKTIPFNVRRVYYLYEVPVGETRGGHAHIELRQLIIAAHGSFDVVLDDGVNKQTFTLKQPSNGLLITPGIWRDLTNFSSGSVCLVLASQKYDERDYIRDYKEFISYKAAN